LSDHKAFRKPSSATAASGVSIPITMTYMMANYTYVSAANSYVQLTIQPTGTPPPPLGRCVPVFFKLIQVQQMGSDELACCFCLLLLLVLFRLGSKLDACALGCTRTFVVVDE
jgi:hypothetical protein